MKRAAIIITSSGRIKWTTYTADGWEDDIDLWCSTSEQLLADLRDAIECTDAEAGWMRTLDDNDPEPMRLARVAARLREWVPEGGTP